MPDIAPAPASRRPLPAGSRRVCWVLAVLDVGLAAWMLAMGDWFDRTAALTRVVTLGGHHEVVLGSAGAGAVLLLSSAVLTENFTATGRMSAVVLAAAVGCSVVAVGGLASLLALAMVVVGLAAVTGRAFLR